LRACDFVDTGNAVHGDFLQDKSTDEVDAETNREKVESRLEQKETLDRRFREKVMQDDQISRGDVENIISEKLDSFLSALADKEKAEQEKQEQATQEALVANSTAAVDFVLRATSISFPADKASEIAGKIQKGELSLDAATQHLLQHKAEELAPADVKEEVVHSEVDELLSDPEFKKVWDTIGLNKQDLEDQLQFEGHEDENPFFGNWEQNAATIESLKLGGAQ
jgi:DNA primase large subunit